MEGKDRPIVMCKKEFEEKGTMAVLVVRKTKPLWGTGKAMVIDAAYVCWRDLFQWSRRVFCGWR